MRNTQYALMALGIGMTLWFASLAWAASGPSDLNSAPAPSPTPGQLTRVSPQRSTEALVAYPVPGYPPRPEDVPAWNLRRSGSVARPLFKPR